MTKSSFLKIVKKKKDLGLSIYLNPVCTYDFI